ncbi:MAG TPA: efflux RND transporter periplasmic adaptor subunit [Patescibacteria group bacterium]|nr:efflux RND transporter periplasmic adaptor subunit [Patescibacteria group bacterium]
MSIESDNIDLASLRINRSGNSYKRKGSSFKKYLIWAALASLMLVGAYYIVAQNSVLEVETAIASVSSPSQASAILNASGYVVAQRKAAVSSKASGRLEQLYVIEGDNVKAGQILGRIENNDVQAAYNQMLASLEVAKANLENAKAELDDATIEFNRRTNLASTNTISTAEVDNARGRFKKAQAVVNSASASVRVAEANIRSAQVQLDNTVIRAPFDGTVLNKNANVGEVITSLGGAAGARGAVVTLADMSSLEVETDVSESNIEKIAPGQPCEITLDAYPSKKYRGYISKIIPTADRAKATVLTKVKFAELDEKVLPEMGAKVLFLQNNEESAVSTDASVTVPADAIIKRGAANYVYLISDGKAKERAVEVGETVSGMITIKQGIFAGDKIIVRPPNGLKDGMAVKLKE